MARTEKYFIGPSLLGDIRRVVARVDGGAYRVNGASMPVRLQDMQRPAPPQMRYVSWTATWPATSTATITFRETSQTATAVNAFAGVGPGEGWAAKNQGSWHLAVVNLTMQPSYTADAIQLLGHSDTGILEWYSVTQCGTTAA